MSPIATVHHNRDAIGKNAISGRSCTGVDVMNVHAAIKAWWKELPDCLRTCQALQQESSAARYSGQKSDAQVWMHAAKNAADGAFCGSCHFAFKSNPA